jgi:hypothetical protein
VWALRSLFTVWAFRSMTKAVRAIGSKLERWFLYNNYWFNKTWSIDLIEKYVYLNSEWASLSISRFLQMGQQQMSKYIIVPTVIVSVL